ncbi:HAD-IC family P-type ATPase [Acidocella aminolytica]|uniref:Cation transporter ATPase n=2 Tax=Acidocella TaxID=50709 RepID=A0A0D6PK92_9PROT|nr:HAD-IC family P-type ATPase [Acidocella aminolytica]GAN82230.1 cation transporter ATPase [Acidocella aminolytica 101 = DSM 11237]GBQ40098.1 cation transport ATPase [Acidocella aminolytica 101 = DSM 11237]SHF23186.1 H+-transporting ATPase [Acidocella aminolytica 101 = DSM 11237]
MLENSPATPSNLPMGLSSAEAGRLLAEHGPNEVAEPRRNPLTALLGNFWAPVPWMLEAAVLLQALTGAYLEAAVIAGLLLFNAALSFAQGRRADTALAALKSRLALTASVRRDGAWLTLPAREIVPGDLVKLSLGAIVPADVRLASGNVLLDQSMITGESLPIDAGIGAISYAGSMVRRGEAQALVIATGARTYSGRAAELVRIAHGPSAEQSAILRVVRNLAVFNGFVLLLMIGYAREHDMPVTHLIALTLTVILATVPVALPATFTLATALGAQSLARRGVLPTRLSAVHEAAAMDVLCADKTGTLTQNQLHVSAVRAFGSDSMVSVLALAAATSSEGGKDAVDSAIRLAAHESGAAPLPIRRFVPFDPARKASEALIWQDGAEWVVMKGAYSALAAVTTVPPEAARMTDELAADGNRVLAVACGPMGALHIAGLVALSDSPRDDAAPLITELVNLGVATVMVTGDAAATAETIAHAVGIDGNICPAGSIPTQVAPDDYAVFAGVFPEDKFRLVKAFQKGGHTVGMCGDGANDAPALRQAQIGIAVATATDVAKAAAGLVLTEPGLGGIVTAIKEGRATFQRILTYTMNALLRKVELVLFLAAGLLMTGHAVLTPMLMVLLLVVNDFLTMSLTTDRAHPSPRPELWRIGPVSAAAVLLGLVKLVFLIGVLAFGHFELNLEIEPLRTLAFFTMVIDAQITVYTVRERRRMWSSMPGGWVLASSALDISIGTLVALTGWLTPPLNALLLMEIAGAAALFAILFDALKAPLFKWLGIA